MWREDALEVQRQVGYRTELMENPTYKALAESLEERLSIIGDTAFRDRDAVAHLSALRRAAERIDAAIERLDPKPPAELKHYLSGQSFQKALHWLKRNG